MLKKLKKTIKALALVAKNPYLLNAVLNDDQVKRQAINKQYGFEKGLPVIDFQNMLTENIATIHPYSFLDGGSLLTDLALLKGLAKQRNVKQYFEIGTWRGESVANVAATGANCVSLCLSDEEMLALGCDPLYIRQHGLLAQNLPNVSIIRGNSLTYDYSKLGKFDLIFIDGDHHSESVCSDTRQVFEHLVHDNSIVVWHDYGHDPEAVRWEVFQGILDGVPAQYHQNLYHVAHTKCAVFIRANYKTRYLAAHEVPDLDFSIQVQWKALS